jgi:hypothetical protein
MGKALSVDLREWVAAAIAGGMSRLAAPAQFQPSVAGAVRWASLAHGSGDVAPKPQRGDQQLARIEVHAPLILGTVQTTPDITLAVSCDAGPSKGSARAQPGNWMSSKVVAQLSSQLTGPLIG